MVNGRGSGRWWEVVSSHHFCAMVVYVQRKGDVMKLRHMSNALGGKPLFLGANRHAGNGRGTSDYHRMRKQDDWMARAQRLHRLDDVTDESEHGL